MGFKVKSNLRITLRERGKIVTRREGHNIWLDIGRVYLASLLGYSSYGPLTPEQTNRISYMGFGVGGTKQSTYSVANNDPILLHYPGTNLTTDTEPGVTKLERPARFSWATGPLAPTIGGGGALIYDPGDVWLRQVQVPTHPITTSATFSIVASTSDFNGGYYLAVPLSEIGLFQREANVNVYNNSPVAFDTFDTIQETGAFDLNVSWTIRF